MHSALELELLILKGLPHFDPRPTYRNWFVLKLLMLKFFLLITWGSHSGWGERIGLLGDGPGEVLDVGEAAFARVEVELLIGAEFVGELTSLMRARVDSTRFFWKSGYFDISSGITLFLEVVPSRYPTRPSNSISAENPSKRPSAHFACRQQFLSAKTKSILFLIKSYLSILWRATSRIWSRRKVRWARSPKRDSLRAWNMVFRAAQLMKRTMTGCWRHPRSSR